jgi:hypothetical protein
MRITRSILILLLVQVMARSLAAQVVFSDQAPATGTSNPSFGRAAVMVDFDGDGLLDLMAVNSGMDNAFFRQLPDQGFESVNGAWAIAPDLRAHWGALATDFDGDGDPDVYVINGGFSATESNQVLRNDLAGAGVFTDVGASSGDGALVSQNFGGAALDQDLDGDLDIFLTTTNDARCVGLRNDGGMSFTDVSSAAGLVEIGDNRHCSAGDFDNDGWVDVAVGVADGENRLYRNLGDGTFLDVAGPAGVASTPRSFGLVLEDFDNDGWLDVFEPKYQPTQVTMISQLFLNDRDGTFTNVSAGAAMTGQSDMGHNTGDVDGDGYPDIYIGTGHPTFEALDLLYLMTPDGSGGLASQDVSDSSGITSIGETRCHGMAFGDYDGDGDMDIYANNGGPEQQPDTLEENALWQNQGNGNGWLSLRLEGVLSNRSAVGARAAATTTAGRQVHRALEVGTGFANTDSPILHFGIGGDAGVTQIELRWPSGMTQTLLKPTLGALTDVTETGMRLTGTPSLGATVSLDLAGPAGHEALIFASLDTIYAPLPKYGGIWQLADPLFEFLVLGLGPGVASVPFQIPNDPGLSGVTAYFQSWIHEPGVSPGGTISGLVPIAIE